MRVIGGGCARACVGSVGPFEFGPEGYLCIFFFLSLSPLLYPGTIFHGMSSNTAAVSIEKQFQFFRKSARNMMASQESRDN